MLSVRGYLYLSFGLTLATGLTKLVGGTLLHSSVLLADGLRTAGNWLAIGLELFCERVNEYPPSLEYTYGKRRYAALTGLISPTLLLALCMNLLMDRIYEIFHPDPVKSPRTVFILISACLPVAPMLLSIEWFQRRRRTQEAGATLSDQNPVCNQVKVRGGSSMERAVQPVGQPSDSHKEAGISTPYERPFGRTYGTMPPRSKKDGRSSSRTRLRSNADDIPTHPVFLRDEFLRKAQLHSCSSEDEYSSDASEVETSAEAAEISPLLGKSPHISRLAHRDVPRGNNQPRRRLRKVSSPKTPPKRSLRLYDEFDFLSDVTALVFSLVLWRIPPGSRASQLVQRLDPGIAVLIVVYITIRAVRAIIPNARTLLQSTPSYMSHLDDLREDVVSLPGIVSCHHLHVWELAYGMAIATLHVEIDPVFGASRASMELMTDIKLCLRAHGIHSCTIQPEFLTLDDSRHPSIERRRRHGIELERTTACNRNGIVL